jgi:hypothetical protein
MTISLTTSTAEKPKETSGEFVTMDGERYYAIREMDKMAPFFISVLSNSDHWLFVASNGGITAGRISPETALFPYTTVDKIYDSTPHTGSKTLVRVTRNGKQTRWEPFNKEHDDRYSTSRNLYKNVLSNKLLFEEINHDLQLVFRYRWVTSSDYGFSRQCEIENIGATNCSIELLDGLQNILPAGTPRFTQTNSSYLVDAYKWSELDEQTGLALFTLFSGITDRAEPCESLKATTVFCLGLDDYQVLLSSDQIDSFRHGDEVRQESHKRGIRSAYWVHTSIDLAPRGIQNWQLVANLEQSQSDAVDLIQQLSAPDEVTEAIERSVEAGSDELARIMAAADGLQITAEENVAVHHYANVQFNILRGGIFANQYQLSSIDFAATVEMFNGTVYQQHRAWLKTLPEEMNNQQLLTSVRCQNDHQLERLAYEYLPITFGRRHGDPSRPWNDFAIRLQDEQGKQLLSYQGNWRDIFQNWEALLLSYPEFIENIIAKFVNASTIDGYNPYRITNEGIDWEVEEPDDPWSYIGYWGDHQIIYLQKLLELSQQFHPARLSTLLAQPIFCYANVPYKIKSFKSLLENAKSTVDYDNEQAERIEQRVTELGADGKLLLDASGQVYQVNLLEKLLVPLLSKLGNLVIDGGIWLNTQRPEWNDANNALVGQGLSMVTLYYMRRYVVFLQKLLAEPAFTEQSNTIELSLEVGQWLEETSAYLGEIQAELGTAKMTPEQRYELMVNLGEASSRYRETIYRQESFSGTLALPLQKITDLLGHAQAAIDHSIQLSMRDDGLFNAYNTLELQPQQATVSALYPMLEGQVAALSSGAIAPSQAIDLLEALFASDLFRADQNSFLLYPDRQLPGFLQKNCLPSEQVDAIPLVGQMLKQQDGRLIERDVRGTYRFNPDLSNVDALNILLTSLAPIYGVKVEASRGPLQELYQQVFNHKAFTGRSGGMFGFEGLGSIYWHMVSKLLLAVKENFYNALENNDCDDVNSHRLGQLYYRVRDGIGFNKTPVEYGAFPTDPYSHSPQHSGAQQPGMTGQVKEELIARFGELGVRVRNGTVDFDPRLLRAREFIAEPQPFRFLSVKGNWADLTVPAAGLAFSWCQTPIVYRLDDTAEASLIVYWDTGEQQTMPTLTLSGEIAEQLFQRSGQVRQLELVLNRDMLFGE